MIHTPLKAYLKLRILPVNWNGLFISSLVERAPSPAASPRRASRAVKGVVEFFVSSSSPCFAIRLYRIAVVKSGVFVVSRADYGA
jgi:hypothetical protein